MLPVDQMLHLRLDCPVNNVAMITPPDENEGKLERTSLSDIYRLTPYVTPLSLSLSLPLSLTPLGNPRSSSMTHCTSSKSLTVMWPPSVGLEINY
jgi:hypothetical protein